MASVLKSKPFVRLMMLIGLLFLAVLLYRNIDQFDKMSLATFRFGTLFEVQKLRDPSNMSFLEALGHYAKKVPGANSSHPDTNLIILAMTDNSFVDMAVNLYISSFKRFGISNYLFIGAGKKACEELLKLNIHCVYFWEDPNASEANNYGSKEFIRKMNIRTAMILQALKENYSVLHTDLDVVFLSDPLQEIENLLQTNNMAILWDHSVYNAGFLAIKATPFSIEVYEDLQKRTNQSETLDDQTALNHALNSISAKYKSNHSYSQIVVLDQQRYLCGKDYFEKNRNFPRKDGSDNCPGCVVVHNNWIVSKEAKVYRFKEATLWWVDDGQYYSDGNRKYLMYFNPFIRNPPADFKVDVDEIAALKTGLAIGEILNRTLIIPRFHCFGNKIDLECPLNSWFSVKNFHKHFGPNYRESSFLLNDLVPESINIVPKKNCSTSSDDNSYQSAQTSASTCSKPDTSNNSKCFPFNPTPFLLLTKSNAQLKAATLENFPSSKVINFTTLYSLSESLIRSNFGKCSDQVLVLSSLLGVKIQFSNSTQEEAFNKKVALGLTRKGYMQLRR